VVLDQHTEVLRFDSTHDTVNPEGTISTTVTYPDPDERRSSQEEGLYSGAVAVFELRDPIHL
jgi:hypothetical protein